MQAPEDDKWHSDGDEEQASDECISFLENAYKEFTAVGSEANVKRRKVAVEGESFQSDAPGSLDAPPFDSWRVEAESSQSDAFGALAVPQVYARHAEAESAQSDALGSLDAPPSDASLAEAESIQSDGPGSLDAPPFDASHARAKPIFWDPSGGVWAGMSTAIVGDSMLRGIEMKKRFKWAQVHVYEDKEALAVKPPAYCQRVFYVSAGNAMYKHRFMYMDNALKLVQTEEFLKKVGGVILLGSVELWDKLYAPTTHSGKTLNPSFFAEMTKLLKELGVPVLQLDDDFINNLKYTADVHVPSGQRRCDLAKHIETSLVDLSQSAVEGKRVDEQWMTKYRNVCDRQKAAEEKAAEEPGCKWCRRGECWDHQVSEGSGGNDELNQAAGQLDCKWCRKGECWDHAPGW